MISSQKSLLALLLLSPLFAHAMEFGDAEAKKGSCHIVIPYVYTLTSCLPGQELSYSTLRLGQLAINKAMFSNDIMILLRFIPDEIPGYPHRYWDCNAVYCFAPYYFLKTKKNGGSITATIPGQDRKPLTIPFVCTQQGQQFSPNNPYFKQRTQLQKLPFQEARENAKNLCLSDIITTLDYLEHQ
jgi:hypothetical protein